MDYTIHEVQALEGNVAVLETANAKQGVTIGRQAKAIEGHKEVVFAYHERWRAANQRANELEERALQAEAERDNAQENAEFWRGQLREVRDALLEADALPEVTTLPGAIVALVDKRNHAIQLCENEARERQLSTDGRIAIAAMFIQAATVAHKLHELLEAGAGRDSREYIEGAALVLATECLQPVKAHDADSGGDA